MILTKEIVDEYLEKNRYTLYLAYRDITEIKNDCFINAKVLDTLFLYGNLLTEINTEIFKPLTNLKRLDLSFNNITKIQGLNWLVNLEHLRLNLNKITKIENLDELTNLKQLEINFNLITKIENLDKLNCLTRLFLAENKISKIENLNELTNLILLDLSLNEEIKKVENIENNTKLRTLFILDIELEEDYPNDTDLKILNFFSSSLFTRKKFVTIINPYQFNCRICFSENNLNLMEQKSSHTCCIVLCDKCLGRLSRNKMYKCLNNCNINVFGYKKI